jgi:hypothetical protein
VAGPRSALSPRREPWTRYSAEVILGVAILVALVTACAFGANPMRLADVRLRAPGLVFAALAIQILIFSSPASFGFAVPAGAQATLHLVSFGLINLFLIVNLKTPGMAIAGAGLAANTLAIATNHGRMPITLAAWTGAGRDPATLLRTGISNNNVFAGAHAHLIWLGDIFPLPPQLPLANTISIGDVLLVVGMTAFFYRSCTPKRSGSISTLCAPLRVAPFRRLLAGRLVSRAGDWATTAAVVTWIFHQDHSSATVGVFLVGRMAASTFGALVAAPTLSRLPQFGVLSFVESGRGAVTLAMLPLAAAHQVGAVVALACLSAALGSVTTPSAAGLVPNLLPRELLAAGNSIHGATRTIVMVAGSLLGGVCVEMFGIKTALAVDVLTFAVAALLYQQLTAPPTATSVPRRRVSRRDAGRSILEDRLVLALVASFTLATAALGLVNASLPAFFFQKLHSPDGYGYAIAAVGAGLFAGELLTALVHGEALARRAVAVGFAGCGALLFVAAGAPAATTAYLTLFLVGACDGATEVIYDTVLQLRLPAQLRSSAFAVAAAVQNGGMIVGLAAAPLALASMNASNVVRGAGAGCFLAAALAFTGVFVRRAHSVETVAAQAARETETITSAPRPTSDSSSSSAVPEPIRFNLLALERLVRQRAPTSHEQFALWHAYLFHLRPFARTNGALPDWASNVVHEAFGELLNDAAPEALATLRA